MKEKTDQEGAAGEATLADGSKVPLMDFENKIIRGDPAGHGMYRAENGVTVYSTLADNLPVGCGSGRSS